MKLLDKEVPPMGMGCWAIGGSFYSGDVPLGFANVDDAESLRVIDAAWDGGIRVFDTAAVYGAGHSERLLGKALNKHPEAIIISKLGTAIDEVTKQALGAETDPDTVLPAIEGSLARLNRESIDLMLLHLNSLSLNDAAPIFEEMEKAVEAGKIRSYGWSTDFPESVRQMANKENFVAVEHAMSVFVDVPTIQSTIESHELTALIRSPLAMGILTGKFDESSVMSKEDVRSIDSDRRDYFSGGKVAPKYLKNMAAVRELLQSGGRSVTQGALCWLLAKSGRNLPLPGARTVKQVIENAGAIQHGPLPPEVLSEIERLIDRDPEGEARAR